MHAGIRTPQPIKEMQKTFPKIYDELLANTTLLERHLCDMQDCEFTLQDGTLYMLQTRNGKRTGPAALRVATDMVVCSLIHSFSSVNDVCVLFVKSFFSLSPYYQCLSLACFVFLDSQTHAVHAFYRRASLQVLCVLCRARGW